MSAISLRTFRCIADSNIRVGRKMKNTASEVIPRLSSAWKKSPRIHRPWVCLSAMTMAPMAQPAAASSTVKGTFNRRETGSSRAASPSSPIRPSTTNKVWWCSIDDPPL